MEKENNKDIDVIIRGITEKTTSKDLVEKGMTLEAANLAINAYKTGVEAYKWRNLSLQQKYEDLCVAVCEKLIMK